jgi:hypothetical protein
VLVPGIRWLADRLGEPIALLDVGTSAGLNLRLDEYRLDYGPLGTTGPAGASVVVECRATGEVPIRPEAPAIAGRAGLDRAPVDLSDPDEVRWMLACVWPDTGRLDRTRAAIELSHAHPVDVVAGDAVDDLPAAVALLPPEVPLVVTTSWVLAYLRRADRRRFVEALAEQSRRRPVGWLSAEGPGVIEGLPDPPTARAGPEKSPALFQDGQVCPPRPDRFGVLLRHGSRNLIEVVEVMHHPGRQQLFSPYPAQLRVPAGFAQVLRAEIELSELRQTLRPQARKSGY